MRGYLSCLIAFAIYAVVSTAWFTTSMLLGPIAQELGINMQQSTLITNSIVLAKVFGAAFAGFLFYKFGLKWGYFIGSAFISSGVLMAHLDSFSFVDPFYIIVAVRFLTGLGSAVALAALVPIAAKHFSNTPRLGMMVSFNINSNLVGSLVAFWLTYVIVEALGGWRIALAVYGYANAILLILWAIIDSKDAPKQATRRGGALLGATLKSRVMWGMVAYYVAPLLFLNSMSLHVVGYVSSELSASLDKQQAQDLVRYSLSLVSIAAVFTPFVGSYLKRRGIGTSTIFISVNAALVVSILCVIFGKSSGLYAAAIIGGAAFGLLVPYLFALPLELSGGDKELAGYIVSGFWSISFALLFANNQLIAYMYDSLGSYVYGFWYLIALLCLSPLALVLLQKRE